MQVTQITADPANEFLYKVLMSISFSTFVARLRFALGAVVMISVVSSAASGQKIDKSKLATAERRARNAAKVITDVSALDPKESIPKVLIDRALAIAVFPETSKVNLLISKVMKGYGVMSRRVADGWSTPAFYGFAVLDKGWTKMKSVDAGIIMLFMDEAILKKFEKDHLTFAGAAGPVGELTAENEKKISGASIIIYALSDKTLRGVEVDDDDSSDTGLNSDNNVNKAIYGVKAREVLWGTAPVRLPIPTAITEFQNALTSMSSK